MPSVVSKSSNGVVFKLVITPSQYQTFFASFWKGTGQRYEDPIKNSQCLILKTLRPFRMKYNRPKNQILSAGVRRRSQIYDAPDAVIKKYQRTATQRWLELMMVGIDKGKPRRLQQYLYDQNCRFERCNVESTGKSSWYLRNGFDVSENKHDIMAVPPSEIGI